MKDFANPRAEALAECCNVAYEMGRGDERQACANLADEMAAPEADGRLIGPAIRART